MEKIYRQKDVFLNKIVYIFVYLIFYRKGLTLANCVEKGKNRSKKTFVLIVI